MSARLLWTRWTRYRPSSRPASVPATPLLTMLASGQVHTADDNPVLALALRLEATRRLQEPSPLPRTRPATVTVGTRLRLGTRIVRVVAHVRLATLEEEAVPVLAADLETARAQRAAFLRLPAVTWDDTLVVAGHVYRVACDGTSAVLVPITAAEVL